MLTIRLSRMGKKGHPTYRLIISEKARDTHGRALEILGSYNPHNKKLQAKGDRINYWIEQGAGMSPTVNNLLIKNKLIKGKIAKATKGETKRKTEKEKQAKEKEAEGKAKETKEEKPADEAEKEAKEEAKEDK